jgi:hypothetical protein
MASRVLRSCRALLAAFAALAVVVAAPSGVFADHDVGDPFDVLGTVHSKNEGKETIVFITDDLGVKNQPITIDMSNMSSQFVAIKAGQPAHFTIRTRENDSYLAYTLVSEGSYVRQTDLGTRENFETRDSSIKAHVQNVVEDDEALAQQHRDNNLRRDEDDDHDNDPTD